MDAATIYALTNQVHDYAEKKLSEKVLVVTPQIAESITELAELVNA